MVDSENPLYKEGFEHWNNIPICLTNHLKHLATAIGQGNEFNYDIQMKNNERLYKLQH